ncbi:TOBE domain-containing protein [Actinomadura keratinilytica]
MVRDGAGADSGRQRLRVLVTSPEVPALVAEITPAAAADLGLADGRRVWTAVKATEVTVVGL